MPKIVIMAALAALVSGQADAHARLIRANPRVGAVTAQPPTELRLWFSETIDLQRSSIGVTGPGGAPIVLGPLHSDMSNPRVVITSIPSALAPGDYRVKWSMTAADTHETEGDFSFKVKPPAQVR